MEDLLKARDAAEILNCDVRTVHRWAETGRLPIAVKVPGYRGALLFRRDDVEELASENAKSNASVEAVG